MFCKIFSLTKDWQLWVQHSKAYSFFGIVQYLSWGKTYGIKREGRKWKIEWGRA